MKLRFPDLPRTSSPDGIQAIAQVDNFVRLGLLAVMSLKRATAGTPKFQVDMKGIDTYAASQARLGCPDIYAAAVVRLWSLVEWHVRRELVNALCSRDLWELQEIMDLKGSMAAFGQLGRSGRAQLLAAALEEKTRSPHRALDRFEAMLSIVGQNGPLDQDVRQALQELNAARNVIVHNNNHIDQRFVDQCPWLSCKVGRRLRVSSKQYQRFRFASYCYMVVLQYRSFVSVAGTDFPASRDLLDTIEVLASKVKEQAPPG